MAYISDLASFIQCTKCGYKGKDFDYVIVENDVYLSTPGKMQKISDSNEKNWAYQCPKCKETAVIFHF